jgi:hypothetical protein
LPAIIRSPKSIEESDEGQHEYDPTQRFDHVSSSFRREYTSAPSAWAPIAATIGHPL